MSSHTTWLSTCCVWVIAGITMGGCTSQPVGQAKHATATTELTDQNFATVVLQSDKPVVVDFWATWCGPCKAIAPAVEAVAAQYAGRAVVGKLDVDANPRVSNTYEIRSIPAVLFFHRGKQVDALVGSRDDMQAEIASRLDQLLAESP